MITILHGDNVVESRKDLVEILEKAKEKGLEVVVMEGKQVNLEKLRSALESGSLFGENRLLMIENLLSGKNSNQKTIVNYLGSGKFDNDLILWEEKEIKTSLLLPEAKIQIYKINPAIFRFLESLRPGNNQEMLVLLGAAKRQEEAEMIFHMLIRQCRYLILAKEEDLSSLREWQRRRFSSQARFFTVTQLRALFQLLLEIDFEQKTSNDPYSWSSRLDLLVASL